MAGQQYVWASQLNLVMLCTSPETFVAALPLAMAWHKVVDEAAACALCRQPASHGGSDLGAVIGTQHPRGKLHCHCRL